jgi:hypothetical protein
MPSKISVHASNTVVIVAVNTGWIPHLAASGQPRQTPLVGVNLTSCRSDWR